MPFWLPLPPTFSSFPPLVSFLSTRLVVSPSISIFSIFPIATFSSSLFPLLTPFSSLCTPITFSLTLSPTSIYAIFPILTSSPPQFSSENSISISTAFSGCITLSQTLRFGFGFIFAASISKAASFILAPVVFVPFRLY
jgi:hypothetical protein